MRPTHGVAWEEHTVIPCVMFALLSAFLDKESGERLSKMVEDACMLLADYNGRLAAEIDDRKQLTRMLADFLRCQKEALAEKEHKLEVRNLFLL